jgi:hypothetical protein
MDEDVLSKVLSLRIADGSGGNQIVLRIINFITDRGTIGIRNPRRAEIA